MSLPSSIRAYLFHGVILGLTLGAKLSSANEVIPISGPPTRSQTLYTPNAFAVGNAPTIDGFKTYLGQKIRLDQSTPVLTLDYGADVAGFPYFEVSSFEGTSAQVELKYSEQFPGLKSSTGDGPWYVPAHVRCPSLTSPANETCLGSMSTVL
jgi:hypothetical protein